MRECIYGMDFIIEMANHEGIYQTAARLSEWEPHSLCPMGLDTRSVSVTSAHFQREVEPTCGTRQSVTHSGLALAGVLRAEGVGPSRGSLPLSCSGICGRDRAALHSPWLQQNPALLTHHLGGWVLLPGALYQEVAGWARKWVRLPLLHPVGAHRVLCLQDAGGDRRALLLLRKPGGLLPLPDAQPRGRTEPRLSSDVPLSGSALTLLSGEQCGMKQI